MAELDPGRCKCENRRCGWVGKATEALRAPSPFDPTDILNGCPRCKGVDTLRTVCDENGCDRFATCGSPTPDGYRQTCFEHGPQEEM